MKNSEPDSISAAEFRRMNNLPPPGATSGKMEGSASSATKQMKPQIRLPKLGDEMNKTEAAWYEQLKRRWSEYSVIYEPFTLRLPSGTRYTPDFVVIAVDGRILEIWEVKGGHIHNDASLRAFKEARAAFPFWNFRFAQKRGTEWTTV